MSTPTNTTNPAGWLAVARSVLGPSGYAKVDHMGLDLLTASVLVNVHDNLNPANAAHFAALPLAKAAPLAWKLSVENPAPMMLVSVPPGTQCKCHRPKQQPSAPDTTPSM